MAVQLTETAIALVVRRAKETGKLVEVSDKLLPGLRLRVTSKGQVGWVLSCRDKLNQLRRFTLDGVTGVAAARDAARDMRFKVRQGADPIADRRRLREMGSDARDGVGTLKDLLNRYGQHRGKALKTWPEYQRRIEAVFAKHLNKPLAIMKVTDLQRTADSWPAPGSASAAVRYLRPVLKWGKRQGETPADLPDIVTPSPANRRDRVLSVDELAKVLPVLQANERPYAAALRFMLWTLARREEVCAARWADIDLTGTGLWTIPKTKNQQAHQVPLPRQAVAFLKAVHAAAKPKPGGLLFHTASGARLANWDREAKRIMAASKTAEWTRHDLRRTGATMLGDMGTLPDIIEAALNHVAIRSQLAATYNRSRYRPQVAAALQLLADRLDEIAVAS